MTFDELSTQTIYSRRGREHERREVVGKYRIHALRCHVDVIVVGGVCLTPGDVGPTHVERVFYYTLDGFGKRIEAEPVECPLDEFSAWVEGK